AAQITFGVEQPVRVIDSQRGHFPLRQELQDQTVGGVENLFLFDPDAGKIVYVEEASVVDLFCGDSPVGQPVGLVVQHMRKIVERVGIAGYTVVVGESMVQGSTKRSGALVEGKQTS